MTLQLPHRMPVQYDVIAVCPGVVGPVDDHRRVPGRHGGGCHRDHGRTAYPSVGVPVPAGVPTERGMVVIRGLAVAVAAGVLLFAGFAFGVDMYFRVAARLETRRERKA